MLLKQCAEIKRIVMIAFITKAFKPTGNKPCNY